MYIYMGSDPIHSAIGKMLKSAKRYKQHSTTSTYKSSTTFSGSSPQSLSAFWGALWQNDNNRRIHIKRNKKTAADASQGKPFFQSSASGL